MRRRVRMCVCRYIRVISTIALIERAPSVEADKNLVGSSLLGFENYLFLK